MSNDEWDRRSIPSVHKGFGRGRSRREAWASLLIEGAGLVWSRGKPEAGFSEGDTHIDSDRTAFGAASCAAYTMSEREEPEGSSREPMAPTEGRHEGVCVKTTL